MAQNPYETPTMPSNLEYSRPVGEEELAGRFTRFAAAFLDGILLMVILVPLQFMTGYLARVAAQEAGVLEQLLMSLVSFVVLLVLHGYLLMTRGQTIGKLATGIQIVDYKTNQLLPFVRVFLFRYLWLTPLVVLVVMIPGTADDFIINIVALLDALFIFGSERRCLHDYIAGSKVVLYSPSRTVTTG